MIDRKRIGQRIAEWRKEQNMTQTELANLTGLRQQSVSRLEAGKHSPGFDVLAKVANALGCNFDFVKQEDSEETEGGKG
jgi:transcriptional regulator with XRE-family HTH domain